MSIEKMKLVKVTGNLKQDERGSYHLLCGGSSTPNMFWKKQEPMVIIRSML